MEMKDYLLKRNLILLSLLIIYSGLIFKSNIPTSASAFSNSNPYPTDYIYNPYLRWGTASWYSKESPGIKKHTASTEVFDDTAMTCAMWGVPFGQKVRVTNLENGREIILSVNDRGPHERYVRSGRIIDLTKSAFTKLEAPQKGLMYVAVEFL